MSHHNRNSQEEAAYRRTLYADSLVLRNKLGIRDAARLEGAERGFVERRLRQGFPCDAHARSYDGFKAIHLHLFQDVYEWAGQERTYTTGRGSSPFAVPEYIESWMQGRFERLKNEKYLMGLSRTDFVARAAEHVNEINAAHPFIDGNGRTQRVWLRLLAEDAGYHLTIRSQDRARWNNASRIGFEQSDHAPMARLIDDRIVQRERNHDRRRDKTRDR